MGGSARSVEGAMGAKFFVSKLGMSAVFCYICGMKRAVFFIFCVAAFAACANQGAESLFNGVDLEGWRGSDGGKWYVEDGCLVTQSGESGSYEYLATERIFKDFDLSLEFKQCSDGN